MDDHNNASSSSSSGNQSNSNNNTNNNKKLEVYLLILKTLEGSEYKDVAQALRNQLEKTIHATRYDYLGHQHKIDLNYLLTRYPNIDSKSLLSFCENLKTILNKDIPPTAEGSNSYLGAGQYSLLRNPKTLYINDVEHSVKSLMSTQLYAPAYKSFSINMLKHLQARKLRGPVCIRRSLPAEFYTRFILHKRLMGHLSAVYCICFDQTGQFIFTGADDHLIKIWSARDGRLLKTLRGHDGHVTDMSVNYENRLLASGGSDKIMRIWDLKTSKLLDNLSSHAATITSVKFAPYNRHGDDRYLVSTSNDGCVIVWVYHVDKFGFKKLKRFQERNRPGGRIVCSSFSTGGSFLACGSSDNYIHVYGFHPECGPYWIIEIGSHEGQVDSIQFSNNGFRFISGSNDGSAAIWSFKAGQWVSIRLDMNTQLDQTIPVSLDRTKNKVMIVQWSQDDRYVLTSSAEHLIKIWNSTTGKLVHILREHDRSVYLIESHPVDPRIFASASHDGKLIIWDIENARVIKQFMIRVENDSNGMTNVPSIYDMKFSPDGNMIATTDSHGFLTIYGNGSSETYKGLPEQMFFHTDYRALIRDLRHFVMDEQTHVAPHLMPRPTLVDMNGDPHPQPLQRFVPDYKNGERIVIPPLSEKQINLIAENVANHSRQEDDEYLAEKQSADDLARLPGTSHMGANDNRDSQSGDAARYNTRHSARYSFRSARNNFMTRSRPDSRAARPGVRYIEEEEEEEQEPNHRQPRRRRHGRRFNAWQLRRQQQPERNETHSDSSTEEDVGMGEEDEEMVEEDEETDVSTETDMGTDEETEIDSEATEIDTQQPSPSQTRQIGRRPAPLPPRPGGIKRATRASRTSLQLSSSSNSESMARRCSARLRDRKRFRRS